MERDRYRFNLRKNSFKEELNVFEFAFKKPNMPMNVRKILFAYET